MIQNINIQEEFETHKEILHVCKPMMHVITEKTFELNELKDKYQQRIFANEKTYSQDNGIIVKKLLAKEFISAGYTKLDFGNGYKFNINNSKIFTFNNSYNFYMFDLLNYLKTTQWKDIAEKFIKYEELMGVNVYLNRGFSKTIRTPLICDKLSNNEDNKDNTSLITTLRLSSYASNARRKEYKVEIIVDKCHDKTKKTCQDSDSFVANNTWTYSSLFESVGDDSNEKIISEDFTTYSKGQRLTEEDLATMNNDILLLIEVMKTTYNNRIKILDEEISLAKELEFFV